MLKELLDSLCLNISKLPYNFFEINELAYDDEEIIARIASHSDVQYVETKLQQLEVPEHLSEAVDFLLS